MKISIVRSAFLFSTIFFAFAPLAYSQEAKPKVEDLAFMAGCWELSVPQRKMTIAEHWMKPSGGSLIGMGRTVVDGKTVSYEFLRIVTGEMGIDYIAKPSSSKDETAFRLSKATAAEVVFENPAHDFPQSIIYKKGDADSLFARIEGMQNGKVNAMDIPMKRIKCE